MIKTYTRTLLFTIALLFSAAVSKAQDVGVSLILSPADSTCGSTAAVVKAVVYNYGSSSISNIPVWATSKGSFTVSLKDTLKKTIAASKQDTITFSATINTNSGGSYTLKVFTNLSSDTKRSNDTVIKTFYCFPFPSTPSGSANTLCGAGLLKFGAKSSSPSSTFWYKTSSATTPFKKGDTVTAQATSSVTYYAASQVAIPGSVTTNFTGTNNQNGNMFNVRILKDIVIDSLAISPLNSGADTIHFMYRSGFITSSTMLSSSGWTDAGKAYINPSSGGSGTKVNVSFGSIILKAGDYSFYVFTSGAYTVSGSSKLNYTTASAYDTVSSGSVRLITAYGVQGYFGTGSSSYFFSPRTWNGTVFYSNIYCSSSKTAITGTILPPVKSLSFTLNKSSKGKAGAGTSASPDEICVGDTMKYDFGVPANFTNAEYGSKWKIVLSMKTAKGTSTANYTFTAPSSSANGSFKFYPKKTDADSVYIIQITASNTVSGCDSVFSRYVHVNQLPSASFTVSNVCFGQPLSLTNSSTPAGKLNYIWYFGNGDSSVLSSPPYKYTGSGSYTITLRAYTAACTNTASSGVTIYNAPYGANILKGSPFKGSYNTGDVYDPDNVCLGDTNVYQITPPKGLSNSDFGSKWVVTGLTFLTPFGNTTKDTLMKLPTSTKNGTFSFFPSKNADSVFILKIKLRTLPGNCDSVMTRYIHVRYKPAAKFTNTNACLGSALTFKDGSTITVSSVTAWAWDFGDGGTSNAQNPSHSYTKAGKYTVKLTAISDAGCGNSTTAIVEQYPRTTVAFGAVAGCNGNSTAFRDSSKLATGNIAAWHWAFGDGGKADSQNVNHTYIKSGPYTIKLVTVTNNGCKDSFSKKIKVLPKPVPAFTFLNACVGSPIYFANNSVDSSVGTAFKWDFNDGKTSSASAPSHIFTGNGTYNVALKATSKNGCFDSLIQQITPYAKPVANFGFTQGCTGQAISFSDSSHAGSGALFNWAFGDGGTASGKNLAYTHSYKKSGTYTISFTVTNSGGCIDSTKKTITIIDFPKASFAAKDVCIGKATSFTNNSTGPGTLNYVWDFGDKSATTATMSPSHTYAAAGSYQVKLSVTNTTGCLDTFAAFANVHALPVAPPWVRVQVGYKVTFVPKDTSLAGYNWYFGTGTGDSSSKKIPTFTYPTADARYGVKLVVTNVYGCSSSRIDSIGMGIYGVDEKPVNLGDVTVYPNPFAGSTTISYTLRSRSQVNIRVYDVEGREVAVLKDGTYPEGAYKDTYDAVKYKTGAGVYFIKIYVDDKCYTTRVVNLK